MSARKKAVGNRPGKKPGTAKMMAAGPGRMDHSLPPGFAPKGAAGKGDANPKARSAPPNRASKKAVGKAARAPKFRKEKAKSKK